MEKAVAQRVFSGAKFRPLLYIFLLALIIRLLYFLVAALDGGVDNLVNLNYDAREYFLAARAIAQSFDFQTSGVNIFGPGYPLFLAPQTWICGDRVLPLLVVQILLSAFNAALLFLLVQRLTSRNGYAAAASVFYAISMTSISLSATLLSDTFFLTLLLLALLIYQHAMQNNCLSSYLYSGLLLGYAALTRSVGMFLIIILLGWSALFFRKKISSGSSLGIKDRLKPLLTLAVVLVIVLGWIGRNNLVYNLNALSFAGPFGLSRITSIVIADGDSEQYHSEMNRFEQQAAQEADDYGSYYAAYAHYASRKFLSVLSREPWKMMTFLAKNIRDNATCESEIPFSQLRVLKPYYSHWVELSYRKGINYRIVLLSLIGFIFLVLRKRYMVAALAASLAVYFALLSGFTLWQGSRIVYPAIIATALLAGVAVIELWATVQRLYFRYKGGA